MEVLVLKSKLERLQDSLKLQRKHTEADIESEINWMSFLQFSKNTIYNICKNTRAKLGFSPVQSMSKLFDDHSVIEEPSCKRRQGDANFTIDEQTVKLLNVKPTSVFSGIHDSYEADINSSNILLEDGRLKDSENIDSIAFMLKGYQKSQQLASEREKLSPGPSGSQSPDRIVSKNPSLDMKSMLQTSRVSNFGMLSHRNLLKPSNTFTPTMPSPPRSEVKHDSKFTEPAASVAQSKIASKLVRLKTQEGLELRKKLKSVAKQSTDSLLAATGAKVSMEGPIPSSQRKGPSRSPRGAEFVSIFVKKTSFNVNENQGNVIININTPLTSRTQQKPDMLERLGSKRFLSPKGAPAATAFSKIGQSQVGNQDPNPTWRNTLQKVLNRHPSTVGIKTPSPPLAKTLYI